MDPSAASASTGMDVGVSAGRTIGRYRVLRPLGAGGMGAVFSAWDDALQRTVAIKVSRPGDEYEARLRAETQALARIRHPHVVQAFDAGREGGVRFLVMEHLDGPTMRRWLDDRPGWRAVVDAFVQAGEGLAAVHGAGLVHRDIKPSNLVLDAAARVRVVDLGLARACGEADVTVPMLGQCDAELTPANSAIGTPAYMAPEQHAGAPVDARADQFAFCSALFEGLFGSRPFRARSVAQLRRAKVQSRLLAVDWSLVPRRIGRAIRRGLRPDPADRFARMDALLGALT